MGIITNGFLIGAKKSAGGINFLKLRGQQVFRNKPQISANYVPSSAQIVQRSLQAALTRSLKDSVEIQNLIKYGWDRHPLKRTNANEFQRDALRLFTRNDDSSLCLISEKESRMAEAATVGYANYVVSRMALGNMPLTKSKWEFPYEAVRTGGGTATFVSGGVDTAKQYLGNKYSQDYVNNMPFKFVVLDVDNGIRVVDAPFVVPAGDTIVSIAVAAPAVQNGNIIGWLYSTSVELDFTGGGEILPAITAITLDGSPITPGQPIAVSTGSVIAVTGTGLATGDVRLHVAEADDWASAPMDFNITGRSETGFTMATTASVDGVSIDIIEVDGMQLWSV